MMHPPRWGLEARPDIHLRMQWRRQVSASSVAHVPPPAPPPFRCFSCRHYYSSPSSSFFSSCLCPVPPRRARPPLRRARSVSQCSMQCASTRIPHAHATWPPLPKIPAFSVVARRAVRACARVYMCARVFACESARFDDDASLKQVEEARQRGTVPDPRGTHPAAIHPRRGRMQGTARLPPSPRPVVPLTTPPPHSILCTNLSSKAPTPLHGRLRHSTTSAASRHRRHGPRLPRGLGVERGSRLSLSPHAPPIHPPPPLG